VSNLPIGWAYLSLGEISQRITKGSTPTSYGFTYKDSGIKFIKTENIDQNGNIDGKTAYIDEATNLFLKRSILRKKDILFSIAGTIGRVGVVKGNNLPANTNQALAIIRLYHDFSYQRYVFYLLRSKIIQNQAKGSKVGVGRANVSLTDVSNFRIPLPPLPEQQRIVARIEELFTKLDVGIAALKKAKALLKQYRQSVLKAAVEGRMTEEWRMENGERIEPASVLLKRIQSERKERLGKKYKPPKSVDTFNLPKLPDGWVWVRLEDISSALGGYAFKSSEYSETGYQIIKIGNVKMNKIVLSKKPTFISSIQKDIVDKYYLKPNDILITLTGTRRKRDYGYVAIVKNETDLLLNQRIGRLRFTSKIRSDYCLIALQNEEFRDRLFKTETGNVGQGNISMKSITEESIPIPQFKEQEQIVLELHKLNSIIEESEQIIDSELKRSQSLRQSILKRAFEGKLVPQDPSDPPASELLERIKAGKTNT